MSSRNIFVRAMNLSKQDQSAPLPAGGTLADSQIRPRFPSQRREILIFVSLGAGNSGFPGNVGKEGPAFKGIKRLSTEQVLNVTFKLPGIDTWMKAKARVVWVSSSAQDGGLEIVDIPDESRRLIDNWLNLRGQAERPGVNSGSQAAQAGAIPASPDFGLDSYQIVLPIEAIEIIPGPQPHIQPPKQVAAQANVRTAASRIAASMAKTATVSQPAQPPKLPSTTASVRVPLEEIRRKDGKFDRKAAKTFALALTGLVAIVFLVGVVFGRLQGGPPPGIAIAQRVVSPAPVAAPQAPVLATQNSIEAPPAKIAIAPVPVRTSPFEMPTQSSNSIKRKETASLPPARMPNLVPGATSRPEANRPARPQQIVHPAAPSAPVPLVAEARPAAPTLGAPVEPHATPHSNPTSASAPEATALPTASETAPLPAAVPAVNSETPIGSVEVIPDLYPSIRMPPQSKTKPSGPAALTIGRLVSRTDPVYPSDALRQRISGTVIMHVVLGVEGRVETATVTDGPTQLRNAALQAVEQWRYEPTLLGTAPVESEEDITLVFRIAARSHSGS